MSARLSPGGALLRSSRMFSIPKPLTPPQPDTPDPNAHLGSTPFPTHLAITTPESSRQRGDWGLKRSLPLRHTAKSSTPAVRVRHIDSVENITDYTTSSHHTLTLQKFQELGIPITVPSLPNRYRTVSTSKTSVFEEEIDSSGRHAGEGPSASHKRWKFKGPWLAGMTEGEFNRYVRKTVRNRRQEFDAYLKKHLAAKMNAERQQATLNDATQAPQPLTAQDITPEQFIQYVRTLRSDRVALFALVGEFLDLAPLNPPSAIANMSAGARIEAKSPNPYAERGPPITHPSAGLSYLRSNSFAENHPIYGPQARPPPVLARIVNPRYMAFPARLGVGGFITDTPQGDSSFNLKMFRRGRQTVAGIGMFDPEIEGGAKCYIEPRSAYVNSSGKVIIKVAESSEEAQVVQKEMIGKAEIYNSKKSPSLAAEPQRQQQEQQPPQRTPRMTFGKGITQVGSSRTYGLS